MSIQQFPPGGGSTVQPVGALGTYTLAVALTPGLYKVTTDTTQTFTTAQLYFQTAAGYRFGAAVRGGEGYVAIPETVTSVTFTSGTFPLLIGFQRFSSYNLLAAPTNLAWSYVTSSGTVANLAFTPPAGATSIGIYWRNGTFLDLATTTSPATGVTLVGGPASFGQIFPALIAARDANGVWCLGAEPTTGAFPYQTFNTSGTYFPPVGSASAEVWVIGGGGGGGGTGVGSGGISGGGGGGAGGYTTASVATSASVAVTIGAAGNGGTSANTGNGTNGNAGGASTFATVTVNGGGFGGSWGVVGGTGACGGGGGGSTNVASTANQGGAGGHAAGFQPGGGGGGRTNAGGNAVTGPFPGAGGNGPLVPPLSASVCFGGGGGTINLTNGHGNQGSTSADPGSGGGGGGRGNTSFANAAAGNGGRVIVRALGI